MEEGIEIGLEKGARIVEQEHVIGMYQKGYSIPIIADALNLTEEKVNSIISPMQ